jgi:hypothetical protein
MFALWLFLNFGQFLENYISRPNILAVFSSKLKVTSVLILTKNGFGYIFGDFYLKLIWSPCFLPKSPIERKSFQSLYISFRNSTWNMYLALSQNKEFSFTVSY